MAEPHAQAPLRQAARDLALVEAQLRAAGIVLSAVAFAMADALRAKSRRRQRERKAAREQARKAS